jgi:hypothetical protein
MPVNARFIAGDHVMIDHGPRLKHLAATGTAPSSSSAQRDFCRDRKHETPFLSLLFGFVAAVIRLALYALPHL